jgi:hypothetical protein
LYPAERDEVLLMHEEIKQRKKNPQDPFIKLGVSAQDKMMFFLLKWVFNAIKRESPKDDPIFLGASFISRADLVKQLSRNPEVLQALGLSD